MRIVRIDGERRAVENCYDCPLCDGVYCHHPKTDNYVAEGSFDMFRDFPVFCPLQVPLEPAVQPGKFVVSKRFENKPTMTIMWVKSAIVNEWGVTKLMGIKLTFKNEFADAAIDRNGTMYFDDTMHVRDTMYEAKLDWAGVVEDYKRSEAKEIGDRMMGCFTRAFGEGFE